MIGVSVTFQYDQNFERGRVVSIAETPAGRLKACPASGPRPSPSTNRDIAR
jgi:hypothetical protein